MRTKQGTLRGYDNDGKYRLYGCAGPTSANTTWCDAAINMPYLTPKAAKQGVQVLKIYSVWWLTPNHLKGHLCPHCAREWAERMIEKVRLCL